MKKLVFKNLFIYLIQFYRFSISPFFPACCRYYPTCSSFAMTTIEKYGVFWGVWMTAKRLFRCHPFSRNSGYDPLP